jgi:hypothetical protein
VDKGEMRGGFLAFLRFYFKKKFLYDR